TIHGRVLTPPRTAESSHRLRPTSTSQQDPVTGSKRPNIHVQVLPFRVGAHHAVAGAFNIVSFADPGALDVGYSEGIATTLWVEGADGNEAYARAFDRVSRMSLSPHDSLNLIDAISKGYAGS
ncbi:Scr1 family TA system antitoxin-like transcriptional regulator, partial [Streptomyces katrae]|uniref:Scr1 family TA system antitoxin-like transcriptional regulator n=1 Tax=Streptomyces katrae TaxID=68223 RepID=UPI001F486047